MFIRHAYNYDRDQASLDSGLKCEDESRAVQSGKDDADINVIVKRFGITGALPQGVRVPSYEDFTDSVSDYRTAVDAIRSAEQSFNAMPADVRSRFQNDPQLFLEYCANPDNLPEMRKLGLAVAEAPKEPAVAEPAKPAE